MRCFVAMAFGYADTDRAYKIIKETLKECGVEARRVDRVEHNDDIDDRIIKEIEDADFVLADLTYARPSAYFEAGYAQRAAPVIYTVRKDHFKPRADDKYGNYRVHFDLQMKNIIDWSDPPGSAFSKRLSRRIRHVIKPIMKRLETERQRQENQNAFAMLSERDRLMLCIKELTQTMHDCGYKSKDNGDLEGSLMFWMAGIGVRRPVRFLPSQKNDMLTVVDVIVAPKLSQHDVGSLCTPWHKLGYDFNLHRGIRPKAIIRHVFLCTLDSIAHGRIMRALHRCSFDSNTGTYLYRENASLPPKKFFRTNSPVKICIVNDLKEPRYICHEQKSKIQLEMKDRSIIMHKWIEGKGKWKDGKETRRKVGKITNIPHEIRLHFIDNIKSIEGLRERVQFAICDNQTRLTI